MNKKEKELFLELCKFRSPNTEKIESLLKLDAATSEVLGMLFSNRMASVAYYVLMKTKLMHLVDREFRNAIRNASLLNEKINGDFLGCIKFLTSELETCGVPYALLKGAYLCHWYPKGCRTSNDIDVLIAAENVGKVSAKLKEAGFKQGHLKNGVFIPATRQEIISSKMMRGETVPFIMEINAPFMKYLEVDINFSLDYKNSNDDTLKEMLARTQLVSVGDTKIRTLDQSDFLLHLCSHLYKEATTIPWIRMKRDMTFYKFVDIYGLLHDFTEKDFQLLFERAKSLKTERELLYCMDGLKEFFNHSYGLFLEKELLNKDFDFSEVIAPTEKKLYRYNEDSIKKRFFVKDRMNLLREVTNV